MSSWFWLLPENLPAVWKNQSFWTPLFDALCSELASRMDERNMSCHINCGELSVTANPAFLYRTLFNLMDNACKYAGAEKKSGIALEHQPYIFDAFYRIGMRRTEGAALTVSSLRLSCAACPR